MHETYFVAQSAAKWRALGARFQQNAYAAFCWKFVLYAEHLIQAGDLAVGGDDHNAVIDL